jgi:hypothetical protein
MPRKLSEFQLSSWVLTLDLLGVAPRMSGDDWLTALDQLLHAFYATVGEAVASGPADLNLFQYGDSITFCHDDVEKLICVGTKVQVALFRQHILARLGLSGGGAYYLDDLTIHHIAEGLPNAKFVCLVGQGVARSHEVFRGIKGPRFIIDEEIGHMPAGGPCWEKIKLLFGPKPPESLRCSELRWWKNFPGIVEMTDDRIKELQSAIESEEATIKEFAHIEPLVRRKIDSLTKRLEHYKCFRKVLDNKDSEL